MWAVGGCISYSTLTPCKVPCFERDVAAEEPPISSYAADRTPGTEPPLLVAGGDPDLGGGSQGMDVQTKQNKTETGSCVTAVEGTCDAAKVFLFSTFRRSTS